MDVEHFWSNAQVVQYLHGIELGNYITNIESSDLHEAVLYNDSSYDYHEIILYNDSSYDYNEIVLTVQIPQTTQWRGRFSRALLQNQLNKNFIIFLKRLTG